MKLCCPVCCDSFVDIRVKFRIILCYCRFCNTLNELLTLLCDIKILYLYKLFFRLYADTGDIVKKQITKGEDTEGKQNLYFAFFINAY